MHETYLTIEEFARFEAKQPATVRKSLCEFPADKTIPSMGRGKSGGTLISSALLSSDGYRRFLACPAPHSPGAVPAPIPSPPDLHTTDQSLEGLNAAQRDEALFWHRIFAEFGQLLALRPDWTQPQAASAHIETLPEECRLSERAFLTRFRAWQQRGLAAVVPKNKSGRPSSEIHPKLKAWMLNHYVRKTKGRSRRLSAEAAIAKAEREGWRPCPSRATLERLLKNTPGNVLFGARGRKALDDHILPSTLRDYSEPAMWLAVGDHHRFDVFARCKDGKTRRLWCTMWLDHRSRLALGWVIDKQPSSRTIAESFRRMATRYGVTEVVEIDNGADYIREQLIGSQWQTKKKRICSETDGVRLQGAFEACGVKRVVRAIVKNAKSKLVERFFATVEDQFGKGLPGYCGKDTVERKKIEEALGYPVEESPDLLEEDDFRELFGRWLEERYHQRSHGGEGMNSRSPAQCFKEEVHEVAHPPKENLDLLFLEPKESVMQRQGFHILGNWYRNPDLQHQYFNPEKSTQERTFILRYDRGDLSQVRVYDRQDVYIGVAPRIGRTTYDTEEEITRRKREHKRYGKLRDDFWNAQETILEADMATAEQIGMGTQALVNDNAPSGSFAKVTRYVLKADGPGSSAPPLTSAKKTPGRVVSMTRPDADTPQDTEHDDAARRELERRIADKLKATAPAAPRPTPTTDKADDRIAARLKSRFFD